MAINITDPVLTPATVALSTLAIGDGFVLSGAHHIVIPAAFGTTGQICVLRFEDTAALALAGATQVVLRAKPTINFP